MNLLEFIYEWIEIYEVRRNDVVPAAASYHSGAANALTALYNSIQEKPWYIHPWGQVDLNTMIIGAPPRCRTCSYGAHNSNGGLDEGWFCSERGLAALRPVHPEECCVKYVEVENENSD